MATIETVEIEMNAIDEAQEIERGIDEILRPLTIVSGGEIVEVAPYRGAILIEEDALPF